MAEPAIPVKPEIASRAHINSMEEYQRLYRLSLDNPEWFWGEQAKAISWFHPWNTVFDADYEEVDFAWFSGGRLNASFNCSETSARRRSRRGSGTLPAHLLRRAGGHHHSGRSGRGGQADPGAQGQGRIETGDGE